MGGGSRSVRNSRTSHRFHLADLPSDALQTYETLIECLLLEFPDGGRSGWHGSEA
jgi:hypothetical protein